MKVLWYHLYRAFIMRYFHANGITSVWVHDGSFNPAKFKTQKSRRVPVARKACCMPAPLADVMPNFCGCRRAATMTPQILVNSRVFELITTPPR